MERNTVLLGLRVLFSVDRMGPSIRAVADCRVGRPLLAKTRMKYDIDCVSRKPSIRSRV